MPDPLNGSEPPGEALGSELVARTPVILVTQKSWTHGFGVQSMGCR